MELLRAEIHHIHGGTFRRGGSIFSIQPAFAGGIVNGYAGLYVIAENIETDTIPLVLYRPGFHQNTLGHQVVSVKHGGNSIENVVFCFLDVVGHHVLEGEHAIHIQIAGAGDQIFSPGVLAGELETNEVTSVIEVFTVHAVILGGLPAGGFHMADAAAFLGGHGLHTDTG